MEKLEADNIWHCCLWNNLHKLSSMLIVGLQLTINFSTYCCLWNVRKWMKNSCFQMYVFMNSPIYFMFDTEMPQTLQLNSKNSARKLKVYQLKVKQKKLCILNVMTFHFIHSFDVVIWMHFAWDFQGIGQKYKLRTAVWALSGHLSLFLQFSNFYIKKNMQGLIISMWNSNKLLGDHELLRQREVFFLYFTNTAYVSSARWRRPCQR